MTTENETGVSHSANRATLARQIVDRVDSCHRILEAEDLPENDPSLHMVLGFATTLDEKLSELTGVQSLTDEGDDWDELAPLIRPEHLTDAIGDLMTATDLCKTLRGYLAATHVDECLTAETTVQQIEKAVRDAWDHVDRGEMECSRHRPRDLTIGTERDEEKRELVKRLLALPREDMREVIFANTALAVAPADAKAEGMALLDRGRSVSNVEAFMYLREKGDVQMVPDGDA